MKTRNKNIYQIQSFKDLQEVKMKRYYQFKYSEKKLELKLLELGYTLHPARLLPSLIAQWTRPLVSELKLRLRDMIFGRRRSRKTKKR